MEPFDTEISGTDGDGNKARAIVRAFPTKVPGLSVHREHVAEGWSTHPETPWVLAHTRSGTSVLLAPDPESAMMLAERVAADTGFDFTLSAAELAPLIRAWNAAGHRITDYGVQTGRSIIHDQEALNR